LTKLLRIKAIPAQSGTMETKMPRTLKLAAFAAAVLLTTALTAHAANTAPRGDQMRSGIDPVTTRGIASPGDPFLPDNGPKPEKSPMPLMECWIEIGPDGYPVVYWKNLSNQDLPPGPNYKTVLGNGDHFSLNPWDTWEPGEVKQFGVPNYDGPMTCKVTVVFPEDDDDVPH
jgi:hypothetical protein